MKKFTFAMIYCALVTTVQAMDLIKIKIRVDAQNVINKLNEPQMTKLSNLFRGESLPSKGDFYTIQNIIIENAPSDQVEFVKENLNFITKEIYQEISTNSQAAILCTINNKPANLVLQFEKPAPFKKTFSLSSFFKKNSHNHASYYF